MYKYFFNLFFWPPQFSAYSINVDNFEVKYIVYSPDFLEESDRYFLRYSTKCVQLKVSGD